jgi:hypothetical protein
MCRYPSLGVILLLFTLICFSLASAGEGKVPLKPDLDALCNKVFNIEYPDGRDITNCRLREPTEFQARWCDKGDTRFDKDWHLVACHVARDYTVGELTIPADSWVHFYPEGPPLWAELSRDMMYQGLLLKNGKKDWSQHFYKDGSLEKASLARKEEIQGVVCAKASILGTLGGRTHVRFHDNGKLESCKLAEPVTIEGQAFKKGDRITFNRDGALKSSDAPPSE